MTTKTLGADWRSTSDIVTRFNVRGSWGATTTPVFHLEQVSSEQFRHAEPISPVHR